MKPTLARSIVHFMCCWIRFVGVVENFYVYIRNSNWSRVLLQYLCLVLVSCARFLLDVAALFSNVVAFLLPS